MKRHERKEAWRRYKRERAHAIKQDHDKEVAMYATTARPGLKEVL